jgi:hypothetical protein
VVEPRFRDLRAEVESRVEPPDFAVVAARARRIRRRRTAAVAGTAALGVIVTVLAVRLPFGAGPAPEPVETPRPPDETGARRILGDPDAQVDPDRWALNAAGDLLSVVVLPDRTFSGSGSCGTDRSAFSWVGANGRRWAWVDAAGSRDFAAVPGGFVVGAVPPECRDGDQDGQDRAYLVDDRGLQRTVTWAPDVPAEVEELCTLAPDDGRCAFSAESGQGWVRRAEPVRYPAGSTPLPYVPERGYAAHSTDSRRLFWSADGETWRQRDTGLPTADNVTVTAAGDWFAFTTDTRVEFSSDGGRSWQVRDLATALRPIRIADVLWTVTSRGFLIGVTTLVATGDVVFRSTDPSWRTFERVDLRTDFGVVTPHAVGPTVYVVDADRWWISHDDGATFEQVSPLP